MTYNVKKKKLHSGLSFANDSIQTDDRGREVYDLPQHLQHIDKQNKTKVNESKLKETILS